MGNACSAFSCKVFTSKNVTEKNKTILKKRKSEGGNLPGVCQNRQLGKRA